LFASLLSPSISAKLTSNFKSPCLVFFRVDVFGKDETVPGLVFDGSDKQPIIEGEDRRAFSGEQHCSSLSIRTVKLYLTNQTLMLMQALQQMNDSFEKPINSREDSNSGVLEKKVCSLKRSHFLLVEEVQGHLIALRSSDSPQTFQVWDGQMVSCVSGTHLRLGLVLGGVEELSPQEQSLSSIEVCDMSLHASLRQIELSLGYIDLSAFLVCHSPLMFECIYFLHLLDGAEFLSSYKECSSPGSHFPESRCCHLNADGERQV